jgi:hypothetical protein
MEGPVNTRGAEDSPFITKDLNRFFFFFTPDVRVPLTEQLIDTVTDIWLSKKTGTSRTEPRRIYLESIECLNGSIFACEETLYLYLSEREILEKLIFSLLCIMGKKYTDTKNCGEDLNVTYDIGKFYISDDKTLLFYGNYNGNDYDLYYLTYKNGEWKDPTAIIELNTKKTEFQPCLTYDGNELWYTPDSRLGYTGHAVFRSKKTESGWGEPEEIISNFAEKPCVDSEGNIYFLHHFVDSSINIIEPDIYNCKKK